MNLGIERFQIPHSSNPRSVSGKHMKKLLYITLFLFIGSTAWTQTIYQRQSNESTKTFFDRVKPPTGQKSISVDNFIVTPYQNNKDTVYIVTYIEELNTFNSSTTHRYFIYLFFPTDNNKYEMMFIAVINNWEKTYVPPIIDNIFFANADKDKAKEIVIFYHYKLPEGIRYDTQVFDAPDINKHQNNLSELTEIGRKLYVTCNQPTEK